MMMPGPGDLESRSKIQTSVKSQHTEVFGNLANLVNELIDFEKLV